MKTTLSRNFCDERTREKKDGEGRRPLTKAALYSDIEAARRLLEQGANVKARDIYGRTPLIAATADGSSQLACTIDIVRLLLAQGGAINAQNNTGRTALMEAVCQPDSLSQREMIQLLLSHSPDLSLKDKNGRTVLSIARATVVPLLKQAGAKD